MHHHGTDVQGAVDCTPWFLRCIGKPTYYINSGVEIRYRDLKAHFLDLYYHQVPKYHSCSVDADVARYIDGIGNWVRANDSWSFESQRYFGTKGLEIQEARVVTLFPRVVA